MLYNLITIGIFFVLPDKRGVKRKRIDYELDYSDPESSKSKRNSLYLPIWRRSRITDELLFVGKALVYYGFDPTGSFVYSRLTGPQNSGIPEEIRPSYPTSAPRNFSLNDSTDTAFLGMVNVIGNSDIGILRDN